MLGAVRGNVKSSVARNSKSHQRPFAFLGMRFPDPFSGRHDYRPRAGERRVTPYATDPDAVLKAAFSSAHGRRIRSLYDGSTLHYRCREHALLALARALAFWTGTDEPLLELLLIRSPLARVVGTGSKWFDGRRDRHWGIERCVRPAINSRRTFWSRRGSAPPPPPTFTRGPVLDIATRTADPDNPSRNSRVEESEHGRPCAFSRAVRLALRDGGPAGFTGLAASAVAILYHLSGGVAGAEFTCGTEQLGDALGCTRQHAGRVLHQLEAAGVIVRIKTGNNLTHRVSRFAWTGPTAAVVAARPPHPSAELALARKGKPPTIRSNTTMSRTRTHRGIVYTIRDAHPVCDEWPWMDEDELQALADDIRHRGQKLPIKLLPDGRIVDGRHRELACLIAGVEPWYETARILESEMRAFVDSLNLHRRHLDVAARQQRVQQLRGEGLSTRAIAKVVGVGLGTVHRDLEAGVPHGTPATATDPVVQNCTPAEPVPCGTPAEPESAAPVEPPKPPEKVKGLDGKTYSASKPKPKPEPIRDSRGRIVPDTLVMAFAAGRAKLNQWRKLLRELKEDVKAAHGEPFGEWLGLIVQSVEQDTSKLSEDLGAAMPWVVCPWIGDDGTHTPECQKNTNGVCRVCLDRSFIGRHQWHQQTDDVKKLIDSHAEPDRDAA
jgi:hypothetical protein